MYIEEAKVYIQEAKVYIENKLPEKTMQKTVDYVVALYSKYGKQDYFGRTLVEKATGLKPSAASKLIKLMLDSKIIEPVKGHGKGKYHFSQTLRTAPYGL